jgi:hypothetical protein
VIANLAACRWITKDDRCPIGGSGTGKSHLLPCLVVTTARASISPPTSLNDLPPPIVKEAQERAEAEVVFGEPCRFEAWPAGTDPCDRLTGFFPVIAAA